MPPGKVKLCIDRTNWEFGKKSFNILMVTACCHGVGLPLYFEVLDNEGGNSSTGQRQDILDKCLWLLEGRIGCLIGDREFIGEAWIDYLLKKKVSFVLRIRENQHIAQNGHRLTARERLTNKKKVLLDGATVMGHHLGISIKSVQEKTGKEVLLVLVTNLLAASANRLYKERWTIEAFFQSLKGRGFRLEESCLKCGDKMKKLVALASIAFAVCLAIGIEAAERKAIPVKRHGYKANSFFRKGLQSLRYAIKNKGEVVFQEALAWLDWLYDDFLIPKIIENQEVK